MVDREKMSKSKNNFYRLKDMLAKGFEPMDLRYLYLSTHYRKTQNFTWEALRAAQTALAKLKSQISKLKTTTQSSKRTILSPEKMRQTDAFRVAFNAAIANDLNTPQALSVVWEVLKSNIPSLDKYDLILSFDEVLGLQLQPTTDSSQPTTSAIPDEVQKLAQERERLRAEKKWDAADAVRDQIHERGYEVEDIAEGSKLVLMRL
jgi:cysteinyl-tRNA synthetase